MNRKQLIGAAAIAAGVTVGGIGGALLGTPSVSSAIEGIDDASIAAAFAHGPDRPRFALSLAADAIGISEDDLRAALQDGQSMAEVAEANGVDPQVVVDALVAEATARIDERVANGELDAERAETIKANLAERATALVNGEAPFRHGPGGRHHRFGGPALEVAAEAIGISEEDLRAALRDGQTVAEVAEANGVDPAVVIDALVEHARQRITEFVNGE